MIFQPIITGNQKEVTGIHTLESLFLTKEATPVQSRTLLWPHKIFQGLRLLEESESISFQTCLGAFITCSEKKQIRKVNIAQCDGRVSARFLSVKLLGPADC